MNRELLLRYFSGVDDYGEIIRNLVSAGTIEYPEIRPDKFYAIYLVTTNMVTDKIIVRESQAVDIRTLDITNKNLAIYWASMSSPDPSIIGA